MDMVNGRLKFGMVLHLLVRPKAWTSICAAAVFFRQALIAGECTGENYQRSTNLRAMNG